jgi:D-tyrosyl-tRNA(Tyr) deacylase
MRVVVQRVLQASVIIHGALFSSIDNGLLVLLGVEESDGDEDINWLCGKILRLRIFNDEQAVMNLSVTDVNGSILVVSQFTLHASTKKGNRPSYIRAAKPDIAEDMVKRFVKKLQADTGVEVKTGMFAADMKVSMINDGPVTIIIDTKHRE